MTVRATDARALGERIEEATLNNLQSRRQVVHDGWLVFLLAGKAKRARSVSAHYASTLPLEGKIAYCEALYAKAGLPALFRITPTCRPADLDAALAARGYVAFDETLVQHAHVADIRTRRPNGDIALTSPPLETFVEEVGALRGSPASQRLAHLERLAGSPLHVHAVLARARGRIAGAGMLTHDGSLGGLFDIVVADDERRRGVGAAIVSCLVDEAAARGVAGLYLQVTEANEPAVALYRPFGFRTVYRYHYRGLAPEVE